MGSPHRPRPRPRRPRSGRTLVAAVAVLALVVASCSGSDDDASPGTTGAPTDTTETTMRTDPDDLDDAQLAEEAYVAGLPLVITQRTIQKLGGLVGVNRLFWQPEQSTPAQRIIVAPNRDTLYSIAVLDLRSGPMVLTLPEVADRYFTYQLVDAWSETFGYVGSRATGTEAGQWVIAPPGWTGTPPTGAEVIESPTPLAFLLGRYFVTGEDDIASLTPIREAASLEPLEPGAVANDPIGAPPGEPQDVPGDATFYDELVGALAIDPPTTDGQRALFDAFDDRFGLDASSTTADLDADTRAVLDAAASAGDQRVMGEIGQRSARPSGWSIDLDLGRYGDDILQRAVVARIGWGANEPAEAVYPITTIDGDGEALSGANRYTITFPEGELPPVDAFWSLTVYAADMFLSPDRDRWSVNPAQDDLLVDEDGSTTITLAAEDPGDDAANWLPVPDGRFVLMLRLYLPGPEILDGSYDPPAVTREAD